MHAVRDLSGGTLLTIITKFAVLLDSTEMLRTFSASALICHLFFDAGECAAPSHLLVKVQTEAKRCYVEGRP